MSSTASEFEKDTNEFHEHAVHSAKALHMETIDEAVAAEQLAKEMQFVDDTRAHEIQEQLQKSRQGGYVPVSPEEWKAHNSLNLKFDFMVVPFCTLIYLFCGLDRANIGNAATDNFTTNLGIPADSINTATSLFIATYVPFMPFTTYIGRRMGQPLFLSIAGFCWGVLTLCQAFIKTEGQLIALRLLIGAFESGFFATASSYISLFYPRFNLAFRISLFFFAYAVSGGFGGLIAYGAFNINGSLWGWQYLFLIEGGITILLALVTPFWLPAGPDSAENLSGSYKVSKRDIFESLKDFKLWIMLPCGMLTTMGPTGFTTFLPIVVKGLGYSGATANLMTVPPYVAGGCLVLLFCWSSDRFHERCTHILVGLTIVIIGLALTVALPEENVHSRYGALIILLAGTFIATPLNTTWLAGNTPEPGKRALILALNSWGNLAQVFSSELFQSKYGPSYSYSMKVLLGLMILAFFGYASVAITLRFVNRSRAKKVAAMTPQELEEENMSDKRVGDRKLTFVYGT
ncbi:MFS general substrate transporter [Calocera cornea HHB12733]|uniref:MFS general substrate transporter n=1 Tax=Calocera cornea HHB12733 TaxID=1353952 RepID=A0A165FI16_9BASI|nr:MFS general substrate transporter [Calocera cornea HHB12733]